MNRKILVVFVALMAVAFLATPVFAIGPLQPLELGKNKNLIPTVGGIGVQNFRGNADGSIFAFWTGQVWVRWVFQDASQAKGLMNNAVIAEYSGPPTGMSAYFTYLDSEELDNKWIYLSSDGGANPGQYWGHGMLYWFIFGLTRLAGFTFDEASAYAAGIVAAHPEGEFWKHNDILSPP